MFSALLPSGRPVIFSSSNTWACVAVRPVFDKSAPFSVIGWLVTGGLLGGGGSVWGFEPPPPPPPHPASRKRVNRINRTGCLDNEFIVPPKSISWIRSTQRLP